MDKIICLKNELKCILASALQYGIRKIKHRFELRISPKLMKQLQKRFVFGGRFNSKPELERKFKLPKSNKFPDGYRVDLLYVEYRVQKAKPIKFNGESFEPSSKMVVKFTRHAYMEVEEWKCQNKPQPFSGLKTLKKNLLKIIICYSLLRVACILNVFRLNLLYKKRNIFKENQLRCK